jgi:hypothetical protein
MLEGVRNWWMASKGQQHWIGRLISATPPHPNTTGVKSSPTVALFLPRMRIQINTPWGKTWTLGEAPPNTAETTTSPPLIMPANQPEARDIIDLTTSNPPTPSGLPDAVISGADIPPLTSADETGNTLAVAKPTPPDLLLVIFIHGFKGDDETFGSFPDRLQNILSTSIPSVKVECIVFPQYEVGGPFVSPR